MVAGNNHAGPGAHPQVRKRASILGWGRVGIDSGSGGTVLPFDGDGRGCNRSPTAATMYALML